MRISIITLRGKITSIPKVLFWWVVFFWFLVFVVCFWSVFARWGIIAEKLMNKLQELQLIL